MEVGTEIANAVVEQRLSETLARARTESGPVLIREGPAEAMEWARSLSEVEGLGRLTVACVEGKTVVTAPWTGSRSLADTPPGPGEARRVFLQLARILASLHEMGQTLRGLDLCGVRVADPVLLIPPLVAEPAWSAPEGAGPEGDWYAFGLVLFHTLTGQPAFDDPSERLSSNGRDPRDIRANLPEELASLAMDLLLVDPRERAVGQEVIEALAPAEAAPTASMAWLTALLHRGGLAVRGDVHGVQAHVGEGVLHVDSRLGGDAMLGALKRSDALSVSARSFAATAVERPDVLRGSGRARAGLLLGQALATTGVKLLVVEAREGLAPKSDDVLEGLLRARPTPAVLLIGPVSSAWVTRCVAAGVRVHGDDRVPEDLLEQVPYASQLGEGLEGALWTLRRTGATEGVVAHLALLGLPRRTGPWARLTVAFARLTRRRTLGPVSRTDPSLLRTARTAMMHLALVAPVEALGLATWVHTKALRTGDADSAAVGALGEIVLSGNVDPPGSATLDATGQGARMLGRALVARLGGAFPKVAAALDGALPLSGGGAADHTVTTLLWLEAQVELGRYGQAASGVRQARVDARRIGDGLLELGALCVAARMGWGVAVALERVLREVSPDQGILTWWAARARSDLAIRRLDFEGALAAIEPGIAVLERWPLERAGMLLLEARMWRKRLRWAVGRGELDTPEGHAYSPAWKHLALCTKARRVGDVEALATQLLEGASRFEGAGAVLRASALHRYHGLWVAGSRGGNLVEAADAVFAARGAPVPAVAAIVLVPELASPP